MKHVLSPLLFSFEAMAIGFSKIVVFCLLCGIFLPVEGWWVKKREYANLKRT